jgi:hypothetical protein
MLRAGCLWKSILISISLPNQAIAADCGSSIPIERMLVVKILDYLARIGKATDTMRNRLLLPE